MTEETKSAEIGGLCWEPKIPFGVRSCKFARNAEEKAAATCVWKHANELVDGLLVPPNDPRKKNKLMRKHQLKKDSAGGNWFDMPATIITPELKKDLELIKLRNVMDPKRHYKRVGGTKRNAATLPTYFQVGTVIEASQDFFSDRIPKQQRKSTLADELLSDPSVMAYRRRKVKEIEEKRQPGGVDKWKIRGKRPPSKHAKHRKSL